MAYGYVHEEYVIDFPVPKPIKDLMDDLEEMDKNEDYRYYTNEEMLDITCKMMCAHHLLTEQQWETLVRRYWSDE